MFLEDEISDLKKWMEENNITWFETSLKQGKATQVTFFNESSAIGDFKKLIKALNARIIFFEPVILAASSFNYFEDKIQFYNTEELNLLLNQLSFYKEKHLSYDLFFVEHDVIYKIERWVEGLDIYSNIDKKIQDITNEQEQERSEFKMPLRDEIAEFAKALAEHENFEKAKNKQQREFLAKSLFPQLVEYSEYTMFLVITIAEFHFNIHIKPIKEKELAQKINELKNQGMSKSKIAASIGASIDVINKFF